MESILAKLGLFWPGGGSCSQSPTSSSEASSSAANYHASAGARDGAARGLALSAAAAAAAAALANRKQLTGALMGAAALAAGGTNAATSGAAAVDDTLVPNTGSELIGWLLRPALAFASLSTSSLVLPAGAVGVDGKDGVACELKTGLEFPLVVSSSTSAAAAGGGAGGGEGSMQLAGLGVRNKKLFGIKNLKIYAFGIYVQPESIKAALGEKYGSLSEEQAKASKWLLEDAIAADTALAVRLVIFYKGLKIGQVRSAFEESLGSRLEAISGQPNKEVLHSFTKLFRDDFDLHRGTTIEISRKSGHVLQTSINGEDAGSVKSSLLCRAFFDLYLGDQPFDKEARQTTIDNVASILVKS